jgi:hypothetical protein
MSHLNLRIPVLGQCSTNFSQLHLRIGLGKMLNDRIGKYTIKYIIFEWQKTGIATDKRHVALA